MSEGIRFSVADLGKDTTAALWIKIHGYLRDEEICRNMLVCKSFLSLLPPLITSIRYSSPVFTQQSFVRFTETFVNLRSLHISPEYDDSLPELDFAHVRLPQLVYLDISCQPLKSIDFTRKNTPSLSSLSLTNSRGAQFKLDLPHLTSLSFEHTDIADGRSFGSSLSACPKLKQMSSYKLWGIGGSKQFMRLPECVSLSLYRSDNADHLDIWAPKLISLNLQACYSLEHVRLKPEQGPTVRVNLVNANIDPVSMRHLRQHPRVGPANLGPEDWEAELFGDDYGMPDPMDDDPFGDDVGVDFNPAMLPMMMAMMQQHPNQAPGAMAWNAEDISDEDEDDYEEED